MDPLAVHLDEVKGKGGHNMNADAKDDWVKAAMTWMRVPKDGWIKAAMI